MNYVLVTGGTNGIGAGIVKRLQEENYSPIILDLEAPDANTDVVFEKVDLLNIGEAQRVLSRLAKKYRILRLVNNVGIVEPALVEDTTPEDFTRVMNLNANVAMCCLQALLPTMRNGSFGRVVSITSRAILGKKKRTAYAASKGALSAMTRTWALEVAKYGITVNAVAPGPIGTDTFHKNNPPDTSETKAIIDRIPVQRLGTVEDVAHAVSFLLHENSGFITGQTLYTCGGITVGLHT